MTTTTPIYQLYVSLDDIRPPIWRRLLVPASVPLPKLHAIFQRAMGWQGCDEHEFQAGGKSYGICSPESDTSVQSEKHVRLCDIAPDDGCSLGYEYDFGAHWQHTVEVEKVLPADEKVIYPVCIGGARACPPEACGHYETFLEELSDPEHEEHNILLQSVGGFFDPEGFDPNAVNRELRKIRLPAP